MLPQVLVLDDPTSELDPLGTQEVIASLHDLNRQLGITVVMVSQDIERLVENADRLLVLSEGQLILDGPPRDVCLHHETVEQAGIRIPQVTQFMISLLSRMNPSPRLETIPLTTEEAAAMLRGILRNGGSR
jgi:ABC-type multidrug transport system ATPase subunit